LLESRPRKEKIRILPNKTGMSARSSSPVMKMRATPPLLGHRKQKVILPNKANLSASSTNKDTSIRCDYLFSEEPNFFLKLKGTKTYLSAVTVYSRKKPNSRLTLTSEQDGHNEPAANLHNLRGACGLCPCCEQLEHDKIAVHECAHDFFCLRSRCGPWLIPGFAPPRIRT